MASCILSKERKKEEERKRKKQTKKQTNNQRERGTDVQRKKAREKDKKVMEGVGTYQKQEEQNKTDYVKDIKTKKQSIILLQGMADNGLVLSLKKLYY